MSQISPADLIFLTSYSLATAGYDVSSYNHLGKFCSQQPVTTGNVLDNITGAENTAGYTDYKCIFIYNSNSANDFEDAVMWFESDTAGGSVPSIGVDTTAASHYQSGTSQAVTIATETTAPGGVSFGDSTVYYDAAHALALGTIPSLYVKGVWIRRVTNNVSAQADSLTLKIAGNTAAN